MATGQPDAAEEPKAPQKPLLHKQKQFAYFYARCWKGAPAARDAGYSAKYAKQTANDLLADERIQAAILEEAAKLGMTVPEAKVRMSEWGRTTIEDVMVIEEEEYPTRIQKPLREIVEENYRKIQFEKELAIRTEVLFTDKDEQKKYRKKQAAAHLLRLIDHERLLLELEQNPEATREVAGPLAKRKVARLDMVKVLEHKAGHMIKKVTPTRYGDSVELHDAHASVVQILKLEGAYAPEKHDITTNGNDLPGSNIMMPDNGRD